MAGISFSSPILRPESMEAPQGIVQQGGIPENERGNGAI